jgi:hypothetical protein
VQLVTKVLQEKLVQLVLKVLRVPLVQLGHRVRQAHKEKSVLLDLRVTKVFREMWVLQALREIAVLLVSLVRLGHRVLWAILVPKVLLDHLDRQVLKV